MERYPLEALFSRALGPFEEFLRRSTAGGIVLMVLTAAAVAVATYVGDDAFHHFWDQRLSVASFGRTFELSWHAWINDGLMALFFLVVGLELKREILVGELSSPRDALLPVAAALGGMIVPALIYLALNAGTDAVRGWGIPMATDIAFAVGILVLLAWRVPRNLIVFLTALAIADDLGAVLVIAVFYTRELDWGALGIGMGIFAALFLLNRGGIRRPLPYILLGIALWAAMFASGVHATIAGILLALTIPARPACPPDAFLERLDEYRATFRRERSDPSTPGDPLRNEEMANAAAAIEEAAHAAQSPLERLEHGLVGWVTFLVIPLFAFANAGVDVSAIRWAEALQERVTLGVALGLALGKFVGIAGFSALTVALGLGRLPQGVSWTQLLGAAWLGGIGFTMSLFIAQLAFEDPVRVEQAKLGILLASFACAVVGLAWLYFAAAPKATASNRS